MQRGEGDGLPWWYARAIELDYKTVMQGREGVTNISKCVTEFMDCT
jgi:hypothetical protein